MLPGTPDQAQPLLPRWIFNSIWWLLLSGAWFREKQGRGEEREKGGKANDELWRKKEGAASDLPINRK